MFALTYRETLHGGFYLLADPVDERPADFDLHVDVPRLSRFVPSLTATLSGKVRLEGFAESSPATGKLVLVPDQRRAIYELSFAGTDGATYRFRGQKEFLVLNPADALTLLQGSVYDEGAREVGRAVLRFDARGNLGSLLRSIRLRWA
jgi:hypothetical protein